MDFLIEHRNKLAIVTSTVAKLNATNAPHLKSEFILINKHNINTIVIDLTQTNYCDSSGLSSLLIANRLCKDSGGKFVLVGLQENVEKIIHIAQLDRVLLIAKNVNDALKLLAN
jgi:anti-anti-sigma factor